MMIPHLRTSGGRPCVRRILISGLLTLAGLIPVARLNATDAPASAPAVTVREERGVYLVAARFQVPQSPALALAVLTDYEQIPRFMPGVETSIVLERASGLVIVEQEAVSHLMMFSKRVHLVLEITEGADSLRFRDRSGSSFSRYEGTWRLCEENGQTVILYELRAEPSFDVPQFLLKRLLRRDAGQMIEGLRREIAERSTRSTTAREP
jgi:ribosome-associated toxin RatA of RatAB toxin-antitoxin module